MLSSCITACPSSKPSNVLFRRIGMRIRWGYPCPQLKKYAFDLLLLYFCFGGKNMFFKVIFSETRSHLGPYEKFALVYVNGGVPEHPRGMIVIHACTTLMIRACTMIIVHVSCSPRLMFRVIKGGRSGGAEPAGKAGGFGGRRPAPTQKIVSSCKSSCGRKQETGWFCQITGCHPIILCLSDTVAIFVSALNNVRTLKSRPRCIPAEWQSLHLDNDRHSVTPSSLDC